VFQFTQIPWEFKHREGIYTLKVATSDEMTAHVYCSQHRGLFRVHDSTPLPSFVHVEERFLIGKPAGAANTLTVASYSSRPDRRLAAESSRGPLATYGGPQPPDKPDLAAPGEEIEAALSHLRHGAALTPGNTTELSGTSLAAPHVTGAAALLLSKNKLLTTADIIAKLKSNARTDPSDIREEVGSGRLDAFKAFNAVP
jgi:subtilisin family serine protease